MDLMRAKSWIALWLCVAPIGMATAPDLVRVTTDKSCEALLIDKMFYTSVWREFKASGGTLYTAGSD